MKLVNYNRPFPTNAFRFFDDEWTRNRQTYRPAVNITELDGAFELELLAPGRVKENFNIALNEGTLEISYTAEAKGEDATGTVRRREFNLTDFTRSFKLDDSVIDDGDINATYEQGILKLTLPKREEALLKAPRQIEVA